MRIDQSDFNKITDLRRYLLLHPDKEMVRASCLHYLGDKKQELVKKLYKKRTNYCDATEVDIY